MRATSRHSADLPHPVLIDSDGSESSPSTSPRVVRHPPATPSGHQHQRRLERAQGQQQADDARVRVHEARLDELQAQLAHVVSILNHLRPRINTSDTSSADQHSSDNDSDSSSVGSAPSRQASVTHAPPSIKREDGSPPAARQSSQRRHQSSRAPGVRVHPVEPTAPPPEPSAPPSALACPPRASTSQAAPERLAKADLRRLSTALEPSKVNRWIEGLLQTFQDYATAPTPRGCSVSRLPQLVARSTTTPYAFLRPLDRWAARQAINTFLNDEPYFQLLMSDTAPEAVQARTSGIELLEYVRNRASAANG